jgi:hypothetical protein
MEKDDIDNKTTKWSEEDIGDFNALYKNAKVIRCGKQATSRVNKQFSWLIRKQTIL